MRIAFYSPIKPPDHPVPSGDRQVARLIIAALRASGHEVGLASRLRTWASDPDPRLLERLRREAEVEAARLIAVLRSASEGPPEVWVTYHTYYRSPDLLGPMVAEALAIPYLTVEAVYAGKRDADAWAPWQAPVVGALRKAAINFCLTQRDREGLMRVVSRERTLHLPPFIDTARFPVAAQQRSPDDPVLITVAMMRERAKLASYRMLAKVLEGLQQRPWRLVIVGDGPARRQVEDAFEHIPAARIRWTGEVGGKEVASLLAGADLFLWPGEDEAYGLVYLEAQASGLAVVAQDTAGVPEVVRQGETGLLTPHGDVAAMHVAIARLLDEPSLRQSMGAAARRFVHEERTVAKAAAILEEGLRRATSGGWS